MAAEVLAGSEPPSLRRTPEVAQHRSAVTQLPFGGSGSMGVGLA